MKRAALDYLHINNKNMYQTINEYDFRRAFEQSDTYRGKYSYNGLRALFDYFEGCEEDTGQGIDLDVVAIACDYTEYASAWDAMLEYQPEDMPTVEDAGVDENGRGMDLVEIQEASEQLALEWLEERTQVIAFDGGIIIATF